MRVARILIAAMTAVAVAAVLTGCVPDAAEPSRTPSASATPVFASDAEALKAAEEAYAAYLKVSDEVGNDGGTNPERISRVAVGQLEADDIAGFDEFQKNGWHSSGLSRVVKVALQSADLASAADAAQALSTYVCEDVSGVNVIDSEGTSVVSPSRPPTQSFQVTFDLVDGKLFPSNREPWTGADVCG